MAYVVGFSLFVSGAADTDPMATIGIGHIDPKVYTGTIILLVDEVVAIVDAVVSANNINGRFHLSFDMIGNNMMTISRKQQMIPSVTLTIRL